MALSVCNPYADFAAESPIFGSLREKNRFFEDSFTTAAKRCTPIRGRRSHTAASALAPSRSATVVSVWEALLTTAELQTFVHWSRRIQLGRTRIATTRLRAGFS
jgi:hypothetical protein